MLRQTRRMAIRLPYRRLLLEETMSNSEKIGDLYLLAAESNPKFLQDDLNSHSASGVNFLQISYEGFTQHGVSFVKVIDGVDVDKTVITDPNHDLLPPTLDAKIGQRFVCLIDAEYKERIGGITQFVAELNKHYKTTRNSEDTEVLVLFSDQMPPPQDDIDPTLGFEVDEEAEQQGLWNNPVWGYVRIHGNRESRVEPQHDDAHNSLIISDFSLGFLEQPIGIFGYQNYVIQNFERRLFTGLHHFLNQLESLENSLVYSSVSVFSDDRTEANSATSILHSIAYDPLVLHERETIRHMESAAVYCNLHRGEDLWGLKKASPWSGAEHHRSLWDIAAGGWRNHRITDLCRAFLLFLRIPTEQSIESLLHEIKTFTQSVLQTAHAHGYERCDDIDQLLRHIQGIANVDGLNPNQRRSHDNNITQTRNLIRLRALIYEKIIPKRNELNANLQNPSLVVTCLRAMFCDRLHELIHSLFTDSTMPRVIDTYQLHGSV